LNDISASHMWNEAQYSKIMERLNVGTSTYRVYFILLYFCSSINIK
jgi:hypothetical protein